MFKHDLYYCTLQKISCQIRRYCYRQYLRKVKIVLQVDIKVQFRRRIQERVKISLREKGISFLLGLLDVSFL